jgi:hypothetical protein
VKYYDKWIDADSDVDGIYRSARSGSLLGTAVPTIATQSTSLTWRLNLAQNYQRIGSGRLAHVPARASGLFYIKKNICEKCEGLIAVNGMFVGVASELAGMKQGKSGQYFSSSLMTRLMQPGPTIVELWLADWTTGKPVLRKVGPPRNAVITASQ